MNTKHYAQKTVATVTLLCLLLVGCSPTPNTSEPPGFQTAPNSTNSPAGDTRANGTVYAPRELYPPAVEGEFGYLNLGDMGEARLEAAIAGEEDPGNTPGINILIKNGEPIPDNVKEEIEQRYFQPGARMFTIDSNVRRAADYHFDMYSFVSRIGGRLDTLSELSGTYVDIIFPANVIKPDYNHYWGARAWDTIHFVGYTETLEEYLANYEEWLISEGITDYELWVMEPEVKAPWIK